MLTPVFEASAEASRSAPRAFSEGGCLAAAGAAARALPVPIAESGGPYRATVVADSPLSGTTVKRNRAAPHSSYLWR